MGGEVLKYLLGAMT